MEYNGCTVSQEGSQDLWIMGEKHSCLKATELYGGSLGDHSKLVKIYHEANHLFILFKSHPIISTEIHL